MKHKNIAVFIPHAGCPHTCSFCNQHSIAETNTPPAAEDVEQICREAWDTLAQDRTNTEIAFFGGSFTAIERSYMLSLLEAAKPYIGADGFSGIRISTRPDAISEEILDILKEYGVTSIELGVQSLNQGVLDANLRGHTLEDVDYAVALIKSFGFSLGLQMMIGLYQDTESTLYETVEKVVSYQPDTVRIYPTVILKGTYLEQLYNQGAYKPISLEKAVEYGAHLLLLFNSKEIKVIRMGLHDNEHIKKDMVAGIYHPAFRELCESRIYLDKACRLLEQSGYAKAIIQVNHRALSKMIGQKRENIEKLQRLGYTVRIKGLLQSMEEYTVQVIEDVST